MNQYMQTHNCGFVESRALFWELDLFVHAIDFARFFFLDLILLCSLFAGMILFSIGVFLFFLQVCLGFAFVAGEIFGYNGVDVDLGIVNLLCM